jgi:hypothetical protein
MKYSTNASFFDKAALTYSPEKRLAHSLKNGQTKYFQTGNPEERARRFHISGFTSFHRLERRWETQQRHP